MCTTLGRYYIMDKTIGMRCKDKVISKYLSVWILRPCSGQWNVLSQTLKSSSRRLAAKILTGTCILQKNQQTFSRGTVDAVRRHCHLEDEDLLHILSRCPAFSNISSNTVGHSCYSYKYKHLETLFL